MFQKTTRHSTEAFALAFGRTCFLAILAECECLHGSHWAIYGSYAERNKSMESNVPKVYSSNWSYIVMLFDERDRHVCLVAYDS